MNCENCPCWEEAEAEDIERALEGLCVEKDGKCACDPCRCKNQEIAEPGW